MSFKKGASSLGHMFRNLDMFWEPINFKFDNGKTKFKTYVGALGTLLMSTIVIYFAASRLAKMFKFVDANVKTEIQYDLFNDQFHYGSNIPGFTFTYGIANFMEADHGSYDDYGRMEPHYEIWNSTYNAEIPLASRSCTPDDFGLGKSYNPK